MVRAVLWLPNRDTQCGFKAFSLAAARALFSVQSLHAPAAEEREVLWYNAEGSKVHVMRAPLEMLRGTLLVRVNQWRDRYRTDLEEAWMF